MMINTQYIKKNSKPPIKNAFLHNICLGLYKNVTGTLEILNSQGLLDHFFSNIIKQYEESASYRIRKAAFLGITTLFTLSEDFLSKLTSLDSVATIDKLIELLPIVYMEKRDLFSDDEEDEDFKGFLDDDEEEDEATNEQIDEKIDDIYAKISDLKKARKQLYDEDSNEIMSSLEDHMFKDN